MKGVSFVLKSGIIILLALVATGAVCIAAPVRRVTFGFPQIINSNQVTITFNVQGEAPEQMAVLVVADDWQDEMIKATERWASEVKTNPNAKPPVPAFQHDLNNPQWIPFQTNLLVELGPGDGKRQVMFSYRYGETNESRKISWKGSGVTVQTAPPVIAITNPPQSIVSQSPIQLQGYSDKALEIIRYDLLDQNGNVASRGEGSVTDQYLDRKLSEFTTNYFTCYDVELTPGTNTFLMQFTDLAGNSVKTNFVVVLETPEEKRGEDHALRK